MLAATAVSAIQVASVKTNRRIRRRGLVNLFTRRVRVASTARTAELVLFGSLAAAFAVFGLLLSFWLLMTFSPFGGLRFQRLVLLEQRFGNAMSGGISTSNSVAIQESTRAFEMIARVQFDTMYVRTREGIEPVSVALVSPEFLTIFQGVVAQGRSLEKYDEEWRDGPVGIVSESYWRNRLGGDADILNHSLNTTDRGVPTIPVVGVLSDRFRGFGFFTGLPIDLILPLPVRPFEREGRNQAILTAIAKLSPGTTLEGAQREVTAMGAQLSRKWGPHDLNLMVRPASAIFNPLRKRITLAATAAAVALLLVVICAAGVRQVTAVDRIGEMWVRESLGAPRWHLFGLLLRENLSLFLFTALVGASLAAISIQRLGPASANAIGLPSALDPRSVRWLPFCVLGVTPVLALTITWAQLAVIGPALRHRYVSTKFRWTRGRVALRRTLVMVQGATAAGLAFAAVASVTTLRSMELRDLGFERRNILSVRVTLRQLGRDNPLRWERFFDLVIEELRRFPGVRGVGIKQFSLGESPILSPWKVVEPLSAGSSTAVVARSQVVHRSFFREMQIPSLAGQVCDAAPSATNAAVINESMAKRYWPDSSPVGKHLGPGHNGPMTIIGVVPSLRNSLLETTAEPEVFDCTPYPRMYLMIRHSGEWKSLASSLILVVRKLDPEATVSDIVPVEELLDRTLRPSKILAEFLASLGAVAVAVAGLSLFAITAIVIGQRRTELAVRMAVGADPTMLGRRLEGETLLIGGLSIAAGWVMFLGVSRYFASLGTSLSLSVPMFGAAGLVLLLLMWLAVWWPAHSLHRINLMAELRRE